MIDEFILIYKDCHISEIPTIFNDLKTHSISEVDVKIVKKDDAFIINGKVYQVSIPIEKLDRENVDRLNKLTRVNYVASFKQDVRYYQFEFAYITTEIQFSYDDKTQFTLELLS